MLDLVRQNGTHEVLEKAVKNPENGIKPSNTVAVLRPIKPLTTKQEITT